MFRDPRPMALWRDSIQVWCRVTQVQCDLGLALWKAALSPVPTPARVPPPAPAALFAPAKRRVVAAGRPVAAAVPAEPA
jgi:hypothetical protein